jgi:hypothetical protein
LRTKSNAQNQEPAGNSGKKAEAPLRLISGKESYWQLSGSTPTREEMKNHGSHRSNLSLIHSMASV